MKNILLLVCILSGINSYAQQTAVEFANFEKYAAENKALPAPETTENRVVFMGNSITEGWKNMHPDFFENNLKNQEPEIPEHRKISTVRRS